MKDLHEVLSILLIYRPEGGMKPEHDSLYLDGPEPWNMPQEHVDRLRALGCSYDEPSYRWHLFV